MGSERQRIGVATAKSLGIGQELRDSELKGFGIRRQQGGVFYFVQTRIRGRLRRMTIGRHGSPWTPETARREAARLLMAIRAGEDPAATRDEARRERMTFADAAERFMELYAPKLKEKTQTGYHSILRHHILPKLGKRPLDEIGAQDMAKAHAAWKSQPRTANLALAVTSKILSWSEEQGFRATGTNPCKSVKRYRENKRERFLTRDELRRLGEILDAGEADGTLNRSAVMALRLLVLTGARLSEILTLRWEYVDLERRRIRLPDSKTGAKDIVLNSQAVALLGRLERLGDNPWVLPGHVKGQHLVNLQKPWREIRRRAGIPDVRIHDLRHSFASIAVDAGGSLPMIGKLLGHRQTQTTARYAHVGRDPAEAVAEAAGRHIVDVWGVAPEREREFPSVTKK